MSIAFAKMDWKLHSSFRIVHQSERPASWFDSRMYCLKCSGMNDWAMNYHSSLYKQKIIYESNLSWLNTIILSQKICIRNNGYNFWARHFIGKVIDSLCKLFSIWLWNQAWFKGLMSSERRLRWTDNGPVILGLRGRFKPVQERYNWSKVMVSLIKIPCWSFIR